MREATGSGAPTVPTRLRAGLTFGAHEAPADVDVGVVPLPLPGGEMARTDDAVGGEHHAACCQTSISSVIGNGAADTAHHFTWTGRETC